MLSLLLPAALGPVPGAAGQVARSQPTGPRPFQPGVAIDWQQRTVYVDGHVVLRRGPLEFVACFAGKEHESIIRLDASAVHVYQALGLIGLEPGHPPQWLEARGCLGPPAGDLVDVAIEWERDGQVCRVSAFDWLCEFEFARRPLARPWVFAGSRRLKDGTLSADLTGEGIALVDMPDCLLALSRAHVSRDAELWVGANTPAIPSLGTPVRLVLRPARARDYAVRMDFRGAVFVDGRYADVADLADLIRLARRLSPDYVQTIELDRTLPADVARLRRLLNGAGIGTEAVRFVREAARRRVRPRRHPARGAPPRGGRAVPGCARAARAC